MWRRTRCWRLPSSPTTRPSWAAPSARRAPASSSACTSTAPTWVLPAGCCCCGGRCACRCGGRGAAAAVARAARLASRSLAARPAHLARTSAHPHRRHPHPPTLTTHPPHPPTHPPTHPLTHQPTLTPPPPTHPPPTCADPREQRRVRRRPVPGQPVAHARHVGIHHQRQRGAAAGRRAVCRQGRHAQPEGQVRRRLLLLGAVGVGLGVVAVGLVLQPGH
jgi:hypothetical protein